MNDTPHKYPPQDLMLLANWIVADKEKKPIPGTAAADAQHWSSYDAALTKQQENPSAVHLGLSFFKPTNPTGDYRLMAIDLDACVHEGEVDEWAQEIVDFYETYTELSPSRTGLHLFLWVRNPGDYPNTKHYVRPPMKGIKTPQIQVYGGVPQGYVTVTSDLLEGQSDRLARVSDLDWLRQKFPPGGGAQVKLDEVQMEKSWTGKGIDLDEVERRVRERLGADAGLLVGEWSTITTAFGEQRYPSASEAYFKLVHEVLHACDRDGDLAVEFLLSTAHCGTWASGNVEHSVDPAKYAFRDWVENRVKKATVGSSGERPEFVADVVEQMFGDGKPEEEDEDDLGLLQPNAYCERFGGGSDFLIRDLLPRYGVVQFYAKPKQGKSLVTMSLAAAVASGAPTCWGRRMLHKGPVLILVGEDPHGVANRLKAQQLISEITDEPVIFLTVKPGNLATGDGLELLRRQMDAVRPVLVIVDTQIANAAGFDENDTKQMAQLMGICERVSQHNDGCLVALVHHTSKNGRGGARGSSVQAGAIIADFEVLMASDREHVRVIPRMAKNWRTPDEFRLRIMQEAVALDADDRLVYAPAIDFRVDPVAAAALEPESEGEPAPAVTTAPPEGGEDAADVLRELSLVEGRVSRARAAEVAHAAGLVGKATPAALRYLEQKLVEKGLLTVDSERSKGVVYK